MKTIPVSAARADLAGVIRAARDGPVALCRRGRRVAALISPRDLFLFERLKEEALKRGLADGLDAALDQAAAGDERAALRELRALSRTWLALDIE